MMPTRTNSQPRSLVVEFFEMIRRVGPDDNRIIKVPNGIRWRTKTWKTPGPCFQWTRKKINSTRIIMLKAPAQNQSKICLRLGVLIRNREAQRANIPVSRKVRMVSTDFDTE